jgi:hypothetical protein
LGTGVATASTKSPSPIATIDVNPQDLNKIALEKYKQSLQEFRFAKDLYDEKRREINLVFSESMDKAINELRSSKKTTPTQMQKRIHAASKQRIIISATAVRDAAMQALGLPPVAPTPPPKLELSDKSKR